MSPASPMIRPWGSPTIQKVGRLFEDFFVIGVSQEDLVTFIRENPEYLIKLEIYSSFIIAKQKVICSPRFCSAIPVILPALTSKLF